MKLDCPRCGHGLSQAYLLKFLRLYSIRCPRCDSLLALDARGRLALAGVMIASILLAGGLAWGFESTVVTSAVIVLGILAGVVVGARVGKLVLSDENVDRGG